MTFIDGISFIIKKWVLVEDIVVVSDLPLANRVLVFDWKQVHEVKPSQISLKLNNIFDALFIIVTEKNMGIVLILNVEFHWRLDQTGDLNEIWSVAIKVKQIKNVSIILVRLWSISLPFGTEDVVIISNGVFLNRLFICGSVDAESLVDFSLNDLDRWLFNRQVGHFNIETMEMNSINTLSNITGKLWFTDFFKARDIWDSASLMEFSEKCVEIDNRSGIDHKLVPVRTLAHGFTLEIIDDLFEVPRER